VLGSELEAAIEELQLIRELRPPANARGGRAERWSYLRRRGSEWVAGSTPSPYGPIASRRVAQRAARGLGGWEGEPAAALPSVRARMRRVARQQRFEDAARLRDRIDALERVVRDLAELDRLRALEVCLVVPAAEDGFVRAYFVRGGRVAATRVLPRGAAGRLEAEAGLAAAGRSEPSLAPDDAEELLLLASFLRRPPPELRVVPLQAERILAA
jgi:DNA polymerase-3 subunit epsilon